MTNRQAWIGFWIVGVIWGSSYLFIRITVEQLGPFQVVFIRTAFAAIGLTLVMRMRNMAFPATWQDRLPLITLGILNTIFPFMLITWGEQSIDSGLAAVLQSTTALFALVVAHFAFTDERITLRKVSSLMVGFIGVVILMSRSFESGSIQASSLTGQLAIVAASVFYALGAAYTRKVVQTRVQPIVAAAGAMITSATITGILMLIAPFFGGAAVILPQDMRTDILVSVVILGVLNTFIAYLVFYPVIRKLGASRSTMVTYVIPMVGLTLGAVFLHEHVDYRLVIGTVLILASIALVNLRFDMFRRRVPAPA